MPAVVVSTTAPLLAVTSMVCDCVFKGMVMSNCRERADVDDDLLHGGDREAVGLRNDGVFARRDVVERVGAVGFDRQFTANAGGRIRERQFGSGDGGVSGVKHSSANGAVLRVLRKRRRRPEQRA